MIRERLAGDLKEAIKAQDRARVGTLRLIVAAIKDREIARRGEDGPPEMQDAEIFVILARMIRQREESAKAYEEGGRLDLAEQERAEIGVVRAYLPRPMSEAEVRRAIAAAISDTGAASIRDLGKVMAHLKAQYTGRMDFSRAASMLKGSFG